MIDPLHEHLISLAAAGRRCAKDGHATNPSTIWRWATEGRGRNRIKLEVIRIGGRTCTSLEALQRFLAALNAPPRGSDTPLSPAAGPTSLQRKAAARAGRELERMGV